MRVALLSYNARAADAIGNLIAEKLAFFLDHGADVRVFVESDRHTHPAVRPHCRVLCPEKPHEADWAFVVSADLVIVEYSQDYRLLELLPLLAPGKGRILLDYHSVTPPELWHEQNREAIEGGVRKRGLVWCADAVLAHSQAAALELETTGFPTERLLRLGHPVDRERFQPGAASQPLKSQLGLGDLGELGKASIILFVGRLAPNKRVPVLVEALSRLKDLTPPVHAVVIGDQSDLYRIEAAGCRQLAAQLGVADRLHIMGQVTERQLVDAYRSADIFVMPSRHEGFCIPALEAMACGLPVVAARATALPETVGGAGLTFVPDDADHLARQLKRVLKSETETGRREDNELPSPVHMRVAVVSFRYGTDFVGGAEKSLRMIAGTLHGIGHTVEVFATCTRAEHNWSNELPEGHSVDGGIRVNRFRIDRHDRHRHRESVRAILESQGPVAPETESEYVEHSLHSCDLVASLVQRRDELDAIVVGPYLFGLTLDVARALPEKTLLLPCFHNEPFARLRAWPMWYERVGGILYHSPEEQAFAEADLGINHPRAACIDGALDTDAAGDPQAGRARAGVPGPYVVYCGRYSAQKALPVLLNHAARYLQLHPDRFTFVFLGQGEVAIPKQPGIVDRGFVDEGTKRDILAGASALIHLSRYESLSYAALEAWAQGTPVIADRSCAVLAGHIGRCGGGRCVGAFDDFARALDDLSANSEAWRSLGRQGQDYVRARYGSGAELGRKVQEAIEGLGQPIAERMRARGLERAAELDRGRWRERFGELVERILDGGARSYREEVEVKPRSARRTVVAGSGTVLVPVRVVNRGSHAVLAEGPGRYVLCARMWEKGGERLTGQVAETPLPGMVIPGRAMSAVVALPVPLQPGTYRVVFEAVPAARPEWHRPEFTEERDRASVPREGNHLILVVERVASESVDSCCIPLLEAVEAALAEASHRQRLPDDYHDVTEGLLAAWKRRIKRKLLGNFKHAYVDVLSRQQSAFNQFIVTALQELVECCATLDHARRLSPPTAPVEESTRNREELEERLARLEARIAELEGRQTGASALAMNRQGT
jgi:glycosyltransferase involved in cell wall biosynthesis